MASYTVVVKTDQIVTKDIKLTVEARSQEEAERKTRDALQTYPDKVEEPGVRRILTLKSHYWIPRDINIVSIEEDKKVA